MTDVIANLFVNAHPSKATLTLFLDRNRFLRESTVSEYSLRQMVMMVLADGSTSSPRDELNDCRSSRVDLAFHGI